MITLKEKISGIVEQLQEPEQELVFEIVKRFLTDDVTTTEDLESIAKARGEYLRGETIPHDAVNWN